MSGCSVTRPMIATGRSHRSQTARTASQRWGSTMATIRSWDSEIMTSNGSRPGSRRGIASRSTRIRAAAVRGLARGAGDTGRAEVLDADDEPLRDQLEGTVLISSFSANGSPTWTDGRFEGSCR